jgi:hypothetical protein
LVGWQNARVHRRAKRRTETCDGSGVHDVRSAFDPFQAKLDAVETL